MYLVAFEVCCAFWKDCFIFLGPGFSWLIYLSLSYHLLMQDDSYLDSYISTIGVDFVRPISSHTLRNICVSIYSFWQREVCITWSLSFLISVFLFLQKIRTVEQDGKTMKLQIVWVHWSSFLFPRDLMMFYSCHYILSDHGTQCGLIVQFWKYSLPDEFL